MFAQILSGTFKGFSGRMVSDGSKVWITFRYMGYWRDVEASTVEYEVL